MELQLISKELTKENIQEILPKLTKAQLATCFAQLQWLNDALNSKLKELLLIGDNYVNEVSIGNETYIIKAKQETVEIKTLETSHIDYDKALQFAYDNNYKVPVKEVYSLHDKNNNIIFSTRELVTLQCAEEVDKEAIEQQEWFQENAKAFVTKSKIENKKVTAAKVTCFRR